MAKKAPRTDPDDTKLSVHPPKRVAAGVPAAVATLRQSQAEMGLKRTALTLLAVNQAGGFDCPGCAWPEPGKPSHLEFCENGAKAVAEEATLRRITPEFFAEHSLTQLRERSDFWLGKQGRLTEPLYKPNGSDYYQPVSWQAAFSLIADRLNGLQAPDQAAFYTSGRTSNEAAFLYQLFVRQFGTNNLPDCSNMCHESSGVALNQTIGVGKGSVALEDFLHTNLIIVMGQNPGTNHPRMLSTLRDAKKRGARIVSINPLPEAGLQRFKDPKRISGVIGTGDSLSDRYLPVRLNGDLALFQAVGRLLLDAEEARPGTVLDGDFISRYTDGFNEYASALRALNWQDVDYATGLPREQIQSLADEITGSEATIICWAMGLTQHQNAVATIREVVNVLLLRGSIGRPGAGVCPVRGHSNVQGDRTMGIAEKMPADWLDRLGAEFGFEPPRDPGLDVVNTIRAIRDGAVRIFVGMGGNFVRAAPDSVATAEAMSTLELTVSISTKLNKSHAVAGSEALILPCLGRTEADLRGTGPQVVTVEDSMGMIHASAGTLPPASRELLSEVAIVAGMATATLGPRSSVDWLGMSHDYSRIRSHIEAVAPGFGDFNVQIGRPGGFALPHPVRDQRKFPTHTGRANFSPNQLYVLRTAPGRLLLQTIRSHDQFNTTIYGNDDRYRGIKNGRRVVFVNPADLAELRLADAQLVDIVSEWEDGDRRAPEFRIVAYPIARGCCAAYFPEANVLVPLDHTAELSNTPASKSITIRLEPRPHP